MASERVKTRAVRRRRAFVEGLTTGFEAPAMFIAGAFEAPLSVRRSTIKGTWKRVGNYIRSASGEYMVKRTERER